MAAGDARRNQRAGVAKGADTYPICPRYSSKSGRIWQSDQAAVTQTINMPRSPDSIARAAAGQPSPARKGSPFRRLSPSLLRRSPSPKGRQAPSKGTGGRARRTSVDDIADVPGTMGSPTEQHLEMPQTQGPEVNQNVLFSCRTQSFSLLPMQGPTPATSAISAVEHGWRAARVVRRRVQVYSASVGLALLLCACAFYVALAPISSLTAHVAWTAGAPGVMALCLSASGMDATGSRVALLAAMVVVTMDGTLLITRAMSLAHARACLPGSLPKAFVFWPPAPSVWAAARATSIGEGICWAGLVDGCLAVVLGALVLVTLVRAVLYTASRMPPAAFIQMWEWLTGAWLQARGTAGLVVVVAVASGAGVREAVEPLAAGFTVSVLELSLGCACQWKGVGLTWQTFLMNLGTPVCTAVGMGPLLGARTTRQARELAQRLFRCVTLDLVDFRDVTFSGSEVPASPDMEGGHVALHALASTLGNAANRAQDASGPEVNVSLANPPQKPATPTKLASLSSLPTNSSGGRSWQPPLQDLALPRPPRPQSPISADTMPGQSAVAKSNALGLSLTRVLPAPVTLPRDSDDAGHRRRRSTLHFTAKRATLGEADVFVVHSWRDDAEAKWAALESWRLAFKARHDGREPKIWMDKCCVEEGHTEKYLAALPFILAGCKSLLVLSGDTAASRLWCAVEVYCWFEVGGHPGNVELRPLHVRPGAFGRAARAWALFDSRRATATHAADRLRLRTAIAFGFGGDRDFSRAIRAMIDACVRHSRGRGAHAGAQKIGHS